MQKIIKDKLLLICEISEKQEEKNNDSMNFQTPLNCYFFSLCVKEFLLTVDLFLYRDRCYHFFDFLNYLGINVRTSNIEILKQMIDFSSLFNFLLNLFLKLPIYEKNQGESDYLLQGVLKIFQILLKFCPLLKEELLKNDVFMKELSHKCLFEMPSCKIIKNY